MLPVVLGGSTLNDFRVAINQICNQRQLSKEVVIETIEAALVSAYKRNFGASDNVEAKIDPDTGKVRVYTIKTVVAKVEDPLSQISLAEARKLDAMAEIGSTVRQETTPRSFGRIAAQTAKQVILQRIREAERDALYDQYIDRAGEIINGTVRNVNDHRNVVLSLGKAEAVLPRSEQIPTERYHTGQRLRAYVVEVEKTSRGPQIVVSRTHRQFLRRLLELEVPEIFNGTVEIKAIAREPGSRSKVAVAATQEGVDPVGSCVGVRGVRIQNVVNELGGEKIDVVAWHPNIEIFVANALSPSKVARVQVDESTKTATVIVPDNQLSLAIGKEGQNARLAAKLTGWRIDIKKTSEAEEEARRKAEEAAAAAAEAERLRLARAQARALIEEAESLIAQEEGADFAQVEEEAMPEKSLAEVEAQPAQAAAEVSEAEPVEAAPAVAEEAEPAEIEEESYKSGVIAEAAGTFPAEEEAEPEEEEAADYDEEEEEDRSRSRRSKKERRRRRWSLVYDEESGETIAQRRRKPSRQGKNWRDLFDWNNKDEWTKR